MLGNLGNRNSQGWLTQPFSLHVFQFLRSLDNHAASLMSRLLDIQKVAHYQ